MPFGDEFGDEFGDLPPDRLPAAARVAMARALRGLWSVLLVIAAAGILH